MKKEYGGYAKHLSESLYSSKKQYKIYSNYYKKNLLNFLPKDKLSKIVDLGCGQGHFLNFLKSEGYNNFLGVDLVKENIAICKKLGLNSKIGDIFLELKKSRGSKVFVLSNLLEHFSHKDIIKILNLMYKYLDKKGKCLIIIPNCNNVNGLATYFSDVTHKSALTEKSFTDLIRKTKFKKFNFHNVIVYPNIFLLDESIFLYNRLLFELRKVNNLLNGQTPFKVHSKNLLVVLEK